MITDRLLSADLIQEFYDTHTELFPDLNYKEVVQICNAPFEMVKKDMQEGSFNVIRLQFFGTFVVYPKRAKALINRTVSKFKKGFISQEECTEIIEKCEKHIKKIDEFNLNNKK
jgi:nucleoid DNA-binding protein